MPADARRTGLAVTTDDGVELAVLLHAYHGAQQRHGGHIRFIAHHAGNRVCGDFTHRLQAPPGWLVAVEPVQCQLIADGEAVASGFQLLQCQFLGSSIVAVQLAAGEHRFQVGIGEAQYSSDAFPAVLPGLSGLAGAAYH
ncbi:PTPA-CTERM sorting domain-containing protein [Aquipseudomonas alcaligenes]|uniref:PTPA-CTERM sorting domain-containing protein n=1 Tax=Aquipseudomonas alcaligenes TaxID=43263 RepID=UPI00373FC83D